MFNIYTGMSVGMGFILFCIVLSFIWITFKNYAKGAFSQKNSGQMGYYLNQEQVNMNQSKTDQGTDPMWPVYIETDEGIIKAMTRGINKSGAFIKCDSPYKPGERFRILIKDAEKKSRLLNAEVVWSNRGIPEERVINRGMGIRFIKTPGRNLTANSGTMGTTPQQE